MGAVVSRRDNCSSVPPQTCSINVNGQCKDENYITVQATAEVGEFVVIKDAAELVKREETSTVTAGDIMNSSPSQLLIEEACAPKSFHQLENMRSLNSSPNRSVSPKDGLSEAEIYGLWGQDVLSDATSALKSLNAKRGGPSGPHPMMGRQLSLPPSSPGNTLRVPLSSPTRPNQQHLQEVTPKMLRALSHPEPPASRDGRNRVHPEPPASRDRRNRVHTEPPSKEHSRNQVTTLWNVSDPSAMGQLLIATSGTAGKRTGKGRNKSVLFGSRSHHNQAEDWSHDNHVTQQAFQQKRQGNEPTSSNHFNPVAMPTKQRTRMIPKLGLHSPQRHVNIRSNSTSPQKQQTLIDHSLMDKGEVANILLEINDLRNLLKGESGKKTGIIDITNKEPLSADNHMTKEELFDDITEKAVITIQKCYRGYSERKSLKKLKQAVVKIQRWYRKVSVERTVSMNTHFSEESGLREFFEKDLQVTMEWQSGQTLNKDYLSTQPDHMEMEGSSVGDREYCETILNQENGTKQVNSLQQQLQEPDSDIKIKDEITPDISPKSDHQATPLDNLLSDEQVLQHYPAKLRNIEEDTNGSPSNRVSCANAEYVMHTGANPMGGGEGEPVTATESGLVSMNSSSFTRLKRQLSQFHKIHLIEERSLELRMERSGPHKKSSLNSLQEASIEQSRRDIDTFDSYRVEIDETLWLAQQQTELALGASYIPRKVLLISNRVPKFGTLAKAAQPDVITIVYDFDSATLLSLLREIMTRLTDYLKGAKIGSLGVSCKGVPGCFYLLSRRPVTKVKLQRDKEMQMFWKAVGSLMSKVDPSAATVHLMESNCAGNRKGEELLQAISNVMIPSKVQVVNPLEMSPQGREMIDTYFKPPAFKMWKMQRYTKLKLY